MAPAALRAIFGSCLALGLFDMAWLDANAARLSGEERWERLSHPLPVASSEPLTVARLDRAQPTRAPNTRLPEPHEEAPLVDPNPPADLPAPATSYLIQFDRSHSVIRSDQSAHLVAIAGAVMNDARAIVRIEGHTDRMVWKAERGDNMTLSENRTLTVARALGKLGVPSHRIRRAAFGDTHPLDDRATEEAYRRNRRVEVRIELTGGR